MSATAYLCPLCDNAEVLRVPDELVTRREPDGGLIVETPFGRVMRVEAALEAHMAEVHDLTPEQAVRALRPKL